MKFVTNRKNFAKALSQIQGLTDRKTDFAITSDVLIKAYGSEITITANNLQTVFLFPFDDAVQ